MGLSEELEHLNRLRERGALDEAEFRAAKEKLLQNAHPAGSLLDIDERTWCMLMHFSQLLGFALPMVGLIVPVLLWQLRKKESAMVNRHGVMIINWILSALCLGVLFWALTVVLIGWLLLWALGIASIAFAIIGGIKANEGEFWPYPLAFSFLKE